MKSKDREISGLSSPFSIGIGLGRRGRIAPFLAEFLRKTKCSGCALVELSIFPSLLFKTKILHNIIVFSRHYFSAISSFFFLEHPIFFLSFSGSSLPLSKFRTVLMLTLLEEKFFSSFVSSVPDVVFLRIMLPWVKWQKNPFSFVALFGEKQVGPLFLLCLAKRTCGTWSARKKYSSSSQSTSSASLPVETLNRFLLRKGKRKNHFLCRHCGATFCGKTFCCSSYRCIFSPDSFSHCGRGASKISFS